MDEQLGTPDRMTLKENWNELLENRNIVFELELSIAHEQITFTHLCRTDEWIF